MIDILESDEELYHYGVGHEDDGNSGRYPYGSGEQPYQRGFGDFANRVQQMRKDGFTEKEIVDALGMKSSVELRVQYSNAIHEKKMYDLSRAKELRNEGKTLTQIAEELKYPNESSIRSLLNEGAAARTSAAKKTADILKKQVDKKGFVDVGKGVNEELGVSETKMREALYILQQEGYEVYGRGQAQVTNPGQQTNIQVLCKPGTKYNEIYKNEIQSVTDYRSIDGGDTFVENRPLVYPASMDSKRIYIRYGDQGGKEKDGLVEIRRDVPDLNLGENTNYAQVRILVDGSHYVKGMAAYGDDIPEGYDMVFNTNKKTGTPMESVLKPIDKSNPVNPFGALIKEKGGQSYYIDPETGEEKLSLINKKSDQGDWGDWDDTLPAQFLSKQSESTIRKQLAKSIDTRQDEYEEILSCTNPTVKRMLLNDFASELDENAVTLAASSFPEQKWHVILPITSQSDKEIYAPGYRDGEQVALVRYPHAGPFEIPVLTVNNKNQEAAKRIGPTSLDAVGINSKVAERLSGADFDGDTVMLIPLKSGVQVLSRPPLKGLEGFDNKLEYPYKEGMKVLTKGANTQKQMGMISNLITDMSVQGASDEELARAVRHSMVVIDAAKHKLDYKQSEIDNDIKGLQEKYQRHLDENGNLVKVGGAATLISRAKAQTSAIKTQGSPRIDPETGKLVYKETERVDTRTGKKLTRKSTQMAEIDDARLLSTGTPQEELYANYANKLKSMANQARLEILATGNLKYSREAANDYAKEVSELKSELNMAKKNAPREREAQRLAGYYITSLLEDNPELQDNKKDLRKRRQMALTEARLKVGAKRHPIDITPRQWEAIQSGAISDTILTEILRFADGAQVREYSMPRATKTVNAAKQARIRSLVASNYTVSEIADALGLSKSVISEYLNQ